MTREWQPGDVAMVTYRVGECIEKNVCAKTDKGWDCLAPGVGFLMHGDVYEARPLAVIDPEDAEQVERLADCWRSVGSAEVDDNPLSLIGLRLREALRQFADPKPPKPDEPTGLGAVVRDADGDLWVRRSDVHFICPKNPNEALTWAEVEAVEVLSEGWSE